MNQVLLLNLENVKLGNPAKGESGTDIKPKKCIISVKYSVNSSGTQVTDQLC